MLPAKSTHDLAKIQAQQAAIPNCQRCPRLIQWCAQVAQEKVKRFQEDDYWGKPVPSFGDPEAGLLIVGLAPAAHGANRTGRMFTGDRSGDWLYRALHKANFASQPTSTHMQDGLTLSRCWITATAHCAPPDNKPTTEEIQACRPYLQEELAHLQHVKVIVALGGIAFAAVLAEMAPIKPKPKFGHGTEVILPPIGLGQGLSGDSKILIGSYHPSQQNTFTGRLTEPMLDAIFERANAILDQLD